MDIISLLALILAKQGSGGGGGAVDSVNGQTGTVVLDADDVGAMPSAAIDSLIELLGKVAYIDNDGQQYIDDLEDALYNRTLSSISAVFTQGSAVITTTTPLDDLKQYLVVTAHYSDNSTKTATDYTLSGTLVVGTSTVTVTYKEKTTTFTVTVTQGYLFELTGSDFEYQVKLNDTSPYYAASQSNFHRTSYVNFDIPISAGTVRFLLTANTDDIKFGVQAISTKGYENVQNNASISSNKYDPGYLHNNDTATIPATFDDGFPPAYIRITFTSENGKNAIALADIVSFKATEVVS